MKAKKSIIIIVAILLAVVIAVGTVVAVQIRKIGKTDIDYPDYPLSDRDSESWEQWRDYDDEVIEIDWWVENPSYNWRGSTSSIVADTILEKTGVKINFRKPGDSSGQQLRNMIAGNELTDIITIPAASVLRMDLQEEGYIYPLQGLSERWAPLFMDRIDEDIQDYYAASDGNLYGLPSNFYKDEDLKTYEDQGYTLIANGSIVARKDYLDAYCAYKKSLDPAWSDVQATTPDGFVEMCLWVKKEYGFTNSDPVVLFSPKDSTVSGIEYQGVQWLMEYFNLYPEDAEGNYEYQYDSERFVEVLEFINALYRNNLIISGNFSTSASQISSYIQNGKPFVCIMSPQNYYAYFKEWTRNHEDAEYIPIVLTNKDGETPQLRSYASNGLRYTMITANCKRPDRVIRLLDYLWSDEGQLLLYWGVEGATFEYDIRPGENPLYPYGKMHWTQEVIDAINTNTQGAYGMMGSQSILTNVMIPYVSAEGGYAFNNYASYISYNLKSALNPYTYNHKNLDFPMDATSKKFREMSTLQERLNQLWSDNFTDIVLVSDAASVRTNYENIMTYARLWGLDEYIEFMNGSYQKWKEKRGVTFGYPPNDPDSGYASLRVTSLYGDRSCYVPAPASVPRI